MADNVQLNLGAGGVLGAADDLGAGVWIQRVKPAWGVDGVAVDVSAAAPLPVRSNAGATAAVTAVARNAASVVLLAAAATRQRARIYNDTDETLYVKYGVTASTASFTGKPLLARDEMNVDDYTGRIDGIWASGGAGNAVITEITP